MDRITSHFPKILTSLIFFCLIQVSGINAQNIQIHEDPQIRELMDKYVQWELKETKISGWRIQIINTDDRRKMEKALSDFRYKYPEVKYSNWKQVSPYYKVIIGAYESKLDVLAFLQDIKNDFPSAIPVIEKIDEREFLNP
jgi:hypothetical protein